MVDQVSDIKVDDVPAPQAKGFSDDEVLSRMENTTAVLNKLLLAALGIKKMESGTEPFSDEERAKIKQRYEMEMSI